MIILAISDIHFRESNPANRIDNYLETLFKKLLQIRTLAKRKKEQSSDLIILVIGGDLFHSFRCSDALKSRVISLFAQFFDYIDQILCVAGQHDQRYHTTDLTNTPINVLASAHAIDLLNCKPFLLSEDGGSKRFDFYGASYGEKIPFPYDSSAFNILAIHRMASDKDCWFNSVDFIKCEDLLKECKHYDLIISGDNHITFNYKNKILNSGSTMRSSIDQKDHKPGFFIYDTSLKECSFFQFDIEPFDKVMKVEESQQMRELDSKLISFVDEINLDYEFEELKFIDNVRVAMNKDMDEEVKEILNECLKGIE